MSDLGCDRRPVARYGAGQWASSSQRCGPDDGPIYRDESAARVLREMVGLVQYCSAYRLNATYLFDCGAIV